MAKPPLITMNPWFHPPVFPNWVTVCHTENFRQNIHPRLPFLDFLSYYKCSLPFLTFLLALSWCDSRHAEVGEFILTTSKTYFCFKIWKKSAWKRRVTVRSVAVIPLETLMGPGLSSPQTWLTPTFVLQKATSSLRLTFWYLHQLFSQIY